MRMPPPITKEDVTMATMMGSLPDVRQACLQMAITWHLGRRQPDMVREDSGEMEMTVGREQQSEGQGSRCVCL